MRKLVAPFLVAAMVVAVIVMLTLLPEVTVGHEPTRGILISDPISDISTGRDPNPQWIGGEPITIPLPWFGGSLVALIAGWFVVKPFVRFLERKGLG